MSDGAIPQKAGLHPRNRHRAGYDFAALLRGSPELARFVRKNPAGTDTIDFADDAAVTALNRALLRQAYGIEAWGVPSGYLCPPVPGRADYIHHLADLLAEGADGQIPRGRAVTVLDVGVGANCIYPVIGVSEYGWHFVGTDVDPTALACAAEIVAANSTLTGKIELRRQSSPTRVFQGIASPGERFTASICNPPFHASAREAAEGTRRKLRNLGRENPAEARRNFGGRSHELWAEGGELGFIRRMIRESAECAGLCGWFTTLVSQKDNLPPIHAALQRVRAAEVRTIAMSQGQKRSRFIAWRFAA